jgi:hypothetical protein
MLTLIKKYNNKEVNIVWKINYGFSKFWNYNIKEKTRKTSVKITVAIQYL